MNIVHMWGKQLVPQILMKQSDTLLTQYRYIKHFICVKKFDAKIFFFFFFFFLQNDSFVKLAFFPNK